MISESEVTGPLNSRRIPSFVKKSHDGHVDHPQTKPHIQAPPEILASILSTLPIRFIHWIVHHIFAASPNRACARDIFPFTKTQLSQTNTGEACLSIQPPPLAQRNEETNRFKVAAFRSCCLSVSIRRLEIVVGVFFFGNSTKPSQKKVLLAGVT